MTSVLNLQRLLSGNKLGVLVVMLLSTLLSITACKARKSGTLTKKPDVVVVEPRVPTPTPTPSPKPSPTPKPNPKPKPRPGEVPGTFKKKYVVYAFVSTINDQSTNLGVANMDYARGVLLAHDSLKRCGVPLELHILDVKTTSISYSSFRDTLMVKKADLVIAPPIGDGLDFLDSLCCSLGVTIAHPLKVEKRINSCSTRICLNAGDHAMGTSIAQYCASTKGIGNIYVTKTGARIEKAILDQFTQTMNTKRSTFLTYSPTIDLKDSDIVFIPSADETFVKSTINNLKGFDANIQVIGMAPWVYFKGVTLEDWVRYNIHVVTNYGTDLTRANSAGFLMRYREAYGVDPSLWAVWGFDELNTLALLLKQGGTNFTSTFPKHMGVAMHNNYSMVYDNEIGAWVNSHAIILGMESGRLAPIIYEK